MATRTTDEWIYRGQGEANPRHSPPRYEQPEGIQPPSGYIADGNLADAVNAAIFLGQPLLLMGEPGTGKTELAHSIAWEFDLPVHTFNTKMNSAGNDLFYHYDSLLHFYDASNLKIAPDPRKYVNYAALGKAILFSQPIAKYKEFLSEQAIAEHPGETRSVVLIDEIDKAPRDFPNDILYETERLAFLVKETGRQFEVNPEREMRPIVIVTSNNERTLPEAFLRRCVFYYIPFPDENVLREIVKRRLDGNRDPAIRKFLEIRGDDQLQKKPATAEMLSWMKILDRNQIGDDDLKSDSPRLRSTFTVLAKTKDDLARLQSRPAATARA
jgi:MoxR-like ATPase